MESQSKFFKKILKLFKNKRLLRTLGVFVIIFIIFSIFFYFSFLKPGLALVKTAKASYVHAQVLKDALKAQNLVIIEQQLNVLEDDLKKIRNDINQFTWQKELPVVRNYFSDAEYLLSVGDYGIEAGHVFAKAMMPFADLLGFITESSTGEGITAEDKVAGIIKIMPQIEPQVDEMGALLDKINQKINQIDSSRYKFFRFKGQSLEDNLTKIKTTITEINSSMPDIKKLLQILPSIMGSSQLKTYLILFQNDKELRPTGGFLTAYALAYVKNGRIERVTSEDIYHLDARISQHPAVPQILAQYLKVKEYFIRDSNLSPDFKVSAQEFYRLWQRASGVPKVDGIFALDTIFVENLLSVLGPVSVPGYNKPFTKDNVVYQLELYTNIVNKFQPERKDLIGVLMQSILQKGFDASKEQWGDLFNVALQSAQKKHLLFYFFDDEAQNLAEKYNFAGRIKTDFDGDYLHINDSNFAGRKANWYVTEQIIKKSRNQQNKVISTVTIDYHNTGNYNAEWNTGYRDWVRIYVPKGSKLISADGSLHKVYQDEDLGKTAFYAYVAVNPKKKAQLTVEYELPDSIDASKLLIQKQPGTNGQEYEIRYGDKVEKFILETDKEIIF